MSKIIAHQTLLDGGAQARKKGPNLQITWLMTAEVQNREIGWEVRKKKKGPFQKDCGAFFKLV